jgi:hypothetical protein
MKRGEHESIALKGTKEQGVRSVDGLIVLGEETKIYEGNTYDITGKDVIVIQTKKQRIGMYLLGQAYFSKLLIEKHNPKSVKSVAICGKNDTVMQELADKHYLEVIVITEKEKYV